jgi:MoxR-like ATPase
MDCKGTYRTILKHIESVIVGQTSVIRKMLSALIAGGHVLLEDYPGTGKTTLAKALARSVDGAEFRRLQFTPDLLPSDVLGTSILDPKDRSFTFHPGPIFTSILLADEINRASPRTQSALLEAMAEEQATIEGKRYPMNDLFFVIATQNPVEFRGTYPLPEAQMDRFAMQLSLGYVTVDEEISILSAQEIEHPLESLSACASLEDILQMKREARRVRMSEELKRYVVELVGATRGHSTVQLPASPRASLTLMKSAQALALFDGSEFVTPDHIHEIARDVIAHRLVLDPQAKFGGASGRDVVEEALEQVKAPS